MPDLAKDDKRPNYLQGAAILAAAAIAAKIIGAIFKIPLSNILDDASYGFFNTTYSVYSVLLTISYSGIPVALSRLVSASVGTGNTLQARKYFRVALPAFGFVGMAASAFMFFFAPQLAAFMNEPLAETGIRALSPAVFLCCVISVFEGYSQGHSDMVPTAIKQMIEVTSKLAFGLAVAWFFLRAGAPGEDVAAGAITGVVFGLAIALPVMVIYKRRRRDRMFRPAGETQSKGSTLANILKISIPVTLGSSCMSIITMLGVRIVRGALEAGAGFDVEKARSVFGVYSKALMFFTMVPALLSPITVSIIPAISAAIASGRESAARKITESAAKLMCLLAMPAAVGLFVLGTPIYNALIGVTENNMSGGRLVSIFGLAAFFACMQLFTTAVLQASGFERAPMYTFPIGGAIQLTLDYFLVSNPDINILGSPIGTLACYSTITVLNLAIIARKVAAKPKIARMGIRPLLLSLVMGAGAWGVYGLLGRVLGDSRGMVTLKLAASVGVGIVAYLVLVVLTKTITREDLKLVPKGEKIANMLKL